MSRHISFTFKHFDIDDRRCGMKVGTDGVALGAWVSCEGVKTAVDIGCGSGLITLMIAQRCGASVEAIDIDEGAVADARANVGSSRWSAMVSVSHCAMDVFTPSAAPDLIVCNPPFFADGEHAPAAERALARHEGSLNYSTLIDFAAKELATSGRLAFIYTHGREDEIIYKAEMAHLKMRRIAYLRQTPRHQPVRTMYEFCRIDGPIEKEIISVRDEEGRSYSEGFAAMCKDFYLGL